MREVYDQSLARTSFTLVMLAIAASMALLLGVVGIYGVISYVVSQRRREIGIRAALGAQQGELKRMFVRHGLALAGVGVAIGLAAAAGLTRLMSTLLYGITPLDPDDVCGGAGHLGDRHGTRELSAGATGCVRRSGRSSRVGVAQCATRRALFPVHRDRVVTLALGIGAHGRHRRREREAPPYPHWP